jgi:hypothetical protein
VDCRGGEIYGLAGRAVGAWPTNDALVMTYVAWPAAEFHDFRSDVEGNFLRTLDRAGDLGERVRSGARAERFRDVAGQPHTGHRPAAHRHGAEPVPAGADPRRIGRGG